MSIKIQTVVSSWKNLNLNALQQELDETAASISINQDKADESRKRLVNQVKEFRKNASEDSCKASSSLIKSFQNEVDFLSKRSKSAEICFLKLYEKYLDIVDPVPCLEYCIGLEKKLGALTDLEIENRTIKETLNNYNDELKEVRNQDVTIKNLKEKLRKYEEQAELTINSRVNDIQHNLIATYEEKEQLLQESHKVAINKAKESDDRCHLLQQSLDQTQSELFDLKSKLDDGIEAKLREIDMLANDLERANQQAASAQKELSALKNEYEKVTTSNEEINFTDNISSKISSIEYTSFEAEISGKDKEISQLIEEINNLQKTNLSLRENYSIKLQNLEIEIEEKNKLIKEYEQTVSQHKDYDEIKRELAIIKSIEFNSVEQKHSTEDSEKFVSKPLELLLLEKNKSLTKENTLLKMSNKELNIKLVEVEKLEEERMSLINKQKNLIDQLETDLLAIQKFSSRESPSNEDTQLQLISEAVRDVSDIREEGTALEFNLQKLESSSLGNTQSATESLLSIVSAQRERFRVQNEKLETEMAAQGSQLVLLQNELDTLRGDNIKLYEKIRFLQSYQGSVNNVNTTFGADSKYSDQYEKSLDPFVSFYQKEKQIRYTSLSPFEKVTLSLGQFVLKNKKARTASFMYLSFLHILIFLVLYKFALTESFKRDFSSDCAKKFAEHMHEVHGES